MLIQPGADIRTVLNDNKFIASYIFKITSTSGLTILNFKVLGAMLLNSIETSTKEGDLVLDSISVRSGTEDKTYGNMLCQFKSTAYSVGITYIQTAIPGQAMEPIYLRKGEISELLVPTIDPFQENPEIVAIKHPYYIDGSTEIVLSKHYPHASIKQYFYPEVHINLARGVCGSLPQKSFRRLVLPTGQ